MRKTLGRRSLASAFALVLIAGGLFAAPAAFGADGEPPADDREANDKVLSATVNDELVATMDALEAYGLVGAKSEIRAQVLQTEIAGDGHLILRYYDSNPGPSDPFQTALAEMPATPLRVEAVPVKVDPEKLNALAQKLSTPGDDSLAAFGVTSVNSVEIDGTTGQLTVYVSGDIHGLEGTRSVLVNELPVHLEQDGVVDFQSRDADGAPWSGGAQLRATATAGYPDCTAGFNWVRWDSGQAMGSTAEHCYEGTGSPYWYNGSNWFGTRYFYTSSRDAILFQGNGYNPNVFVGSATTNDLRWVTGAVASEPVGTAIALSGGRSGLNAGTILSTTIYASGKGPFRETTVTACMRGDSGGPWLTTTTAGAAIAHGQHGGIRRLAGTSRCFYMPVTPISAALAANIYRAW